MDDILECDHSSGSYSALLFMGALSFPIILDSNIHLQSSTIFSNLWRQNFYSTFNFHQFCLFTLGVPAEEVARNAVDELTNNLEYDSCVDEHLQDQVESTYNEWVHAFSECFSMSTKVKINSLESLWNCQIYTQCIHQKSMTEVVCNI